MPKNGICSEKRTNKSIRQELHISESWLLIQIKQRKLKYFGHIKHHECLEKRIMEGYIPERRKRGRPKRRWFQDIRYK
jgi:hypothetical protein